MPEQCHSIGPRPDYSRGDLKGDVRREIPFRLGASLDQYYSHFIGCHGILSRDTSLHLEGAHMGINIQDTLESNPIDGRTMNHGKHPLFTLSTTLIKTDLTDLLLEFSDLDPVMDDIGKNAAVFHEISVELHDVDFGG